PVAVTGNPMDALWAEYASWLRARISPARNVTEGDLLARAFSLSSPVQTQDGARWYVQGDGYTHPKLMRQAVGETPQALRETEEDTRLSADAGDGVLMSQVEICRGYNLLYDLHAIDTRGKRAD